LVFDFCIIKSIESSKAKGEKMKKEPVLLLLLAGFMIALILAIHPSQSVFAQDICGYDSNKQPIPCPKKKPNYLNTPKPVYPTRTATPTATYTPSPAPTDTPSPAPQPGAANSTTAGSLFLISQGSGAGCQNNLDTGPNGGGSPISPILLGGGGLLAGILIGLLLPAVQRGLTGGGGARGGIIAPTDDAGIVGPDKPTGASTLFAKRGGAGISAGNIISGNNTLDNTGGPSNTPAQEAGLKMDGVREDKWAKAGSGKGDDWAKAQQDKEDKWIKGSGAQDAGYKEDKWTKGSGPQDSHLNGDG
jgi:hypothetical protein